MSSKTPIQARAKATRKKLLESAARSLCEFGCRGTTTTVVAAGAGVSQGALYKHFGSKNKLMAATTEYLFSGLVDEFRNAFAAGYGEKDNLSLALRELWAVFLRPELYAIVELYIAARTDEALRQALVPVLWRHRVTLFEEAKRLFPDAAANNPRFVLAVEGLLSAMQGAALSAAVLPEVSEAPEFVDFVEQVCRRELEPPYGGAS